MSSSSSTNPSSSSSNNSVDKFSISSLLWRAGWSPSGLLSFRKDPIPATLLGTLEHDQHQHPASFFTERLSVTAQSMEELTSKSSSAASSTLPSPSAPLQQQNSTNSNTSASGRRSPINNNNNNRNTNHLLNYRTNGISLGIPLNAAVRCGGMLMDNFETGHASLAPIGAFFASSSSSSKDTNDDDENQKTSNIASKNTSAISPTRASSSSPLSPGSAYLKTQFEDDILLSSRCKIAVDSEGLFDPEFYLHHKVKSSTQASGSWFGGGETLSELDSLIFTISTQIWNIPSASSDSSSSSSSTMQRKQIANFKVTRLWKEVKRVALLLHELHPELLLPHFEHLDTIAEDDFRRAQQQFSNNQHNNHNDEDRSAFVFVGGDGDDTSDLEIRLEMIRSLVSSFQRNSAASTHSPVIAMFLLEEDHDAFYRFLSTMEAQLKSQTDAKSQNINSAIEHKSMKELEKMNPEAAKAAKKEKEPGFFASLFGSSSSSSSDVTKKSSKNKNGDSSSSGNAKHSRSNSSGKSSGQNGGDDDPTAKMYAAMIPSTPEQLYEADTRVSTCQFLIQDINSDLKYWKKAYEGFMALDASTRRMLSMSRHQLDHVRDYSDSLVEFTNELVGTAGIRKGSFMDKFLSSPPPSSLLSPTSGVTSPSSSTSNKNQEEEPELKNDSLWRNPGVSTTTTTTTSEYYYEGQQLVEAETKSNLRMAVMLMGCRGDSLQGAENMLSALCQCSKACLLISRSIVTYLQQHRILAERASQLAHVSQQDSEHLLDFIIHIVRPISVEEILEAKKELKTREHTMSVLFYSLSRQLCDTVLRCCATLQNEDSMMQKEQEEQLEFTISAGGGGAAAVAEALAEGQSIKNNSNVSMSQDSLPM